MRTSISILLLLLALGAKGLSPESLFKDAAKAYQQGDFRKAATFYEQIMAEHRVYAAEVYFNLGNAYYKLNDSPSAILNYERALREAPHDEDVEYNLRLARTRIEDKIEPVPQLFYIRWYRGLRDALHTDSWAILGLFFLSLSAVFWAFFLAGKRLALRKMGFYGGLAGLLLGIFALYTAFHAWNEHFNTKQAVVFAGSVSVKSAPVNSSTGLFILHAGSTVRQIDEIGEWVRVRLADGKEGWMLKADLEYI